MSFSKVREYRIRGPLQFNPPAYVFTQTEEFPVGSSSRVGKALWTECGGEIYITCAACGTINSLVEFDIAERGYGLDVSAKDFAVPCVHCRECGAAFWVHFENWEKVSEKTRLAKVPKKWRRR